MGGPWTARLVRFIMAVGRFKIQEGGGGGGQIFAQRRLKEKGLLLFLPKHRTGTSQATYIAMTTESQGVKIDGFLYSIFT